jgi:pilus assembly protein CpaE
VAETLQVLCLSPDGATAAGVAAMLASLPGFAIASRTAGYDEGVADLREPEVAIVVLGDVPDGGLATIDAVRRGAHAAYVVAVSPDDDPETLVRAMRAGADEYLSLPLSQQDLLKVCVKVAESRRGGSVAKASRGGELWVVYGPKGGVGATTIAVNLALAVRATGRNVALVDLDVWAGDVACFLNLTPMYTIREVVAGFDRLDPMFVQGMMTRHGSGVDVLAAPSAGRGAPPREPSGAETTGILELVSGMHEVTVVDTPGIASDATRAALLAADRVLLVTDLTIPALRACARTLDWLRGESEDAAGTVEVVVNKHANRSGEIAPTEAARTLDAPIRAIIPRDDAAGWAAANTGRPLADVPEGVTLVRAIAAIASRNGTPAEAGRRGGRLFRLLAGI